MLGVVAISSPSLVAITLKGTLGLGEIHSPIAPVVSQRVYGIGDLPGRVWPTAGIRRRTGVQGGITRWGGITRMSWPVSTSLGVRAPRGAIGLREDLGLVEGYRVGVRAGPPGSTNSFPGLARIDDPRRGDAGVAGQVMAVPRPIVGGLALWEGKPGEPGADGALCTNRLVGSQAGCY